MNCYWCKTELIWHGDHDGEEEDSYFSYFYLFWRIYLKILYLYILVV